MTLFSCVNIEKVFFLARAIRVIPVSWANFIASEVGAEMATTIGMPTRAALAMIS